jgi:DNA-binding PadR family transcriptional regulator
VLAVTTFDGVDRSASELSLTEWSVLGFIVEGDTYGFSVAKDFAPDGEAGRVWTVARPLVYRAIDALSALDLVRAVGSEPGSGGPRRTLIRATPSGAEAVAKWLDEPIEHVRDARSHLLMKLLLIERRHGSPDRLAARQIEVLASMTAGLKRQLAAAEGFDVLLAKWRLYSAETLERFLKELTPG